MDDEPDVTITVPYHDALRLSYMARFPAGPRGRTPRERARDERVAEAVDRAVKEAETRWEAEHPDAQ